jgi:hypothetical protein
MHKSTEQRENKEVSGRMSPRHRITYSTGLKIDKLMLFFLDFILEVLSNLVLLTDKFCVTSFCKVSRFWTNLAILNFTKLDIRKL